ncbi:putative amino acid transporter [Trypanosoma cruzi]|nr:putative amino acid transporter [Trypanosoma cruzi]
MCVLVKRRCFFTILFYFVNLWLTVIERNRELLVSRRFVIILVFTATRDPCRLIEGNGSVFFYTATGRSDIGARMLDLARQHGDVRVQLAFVDEHGPLDAVVAAAATMTGLRLVSGNIAMHWEEPTVAGTWRIAGRLKYLISRINCSRSSCGRHPGVGGPAGADHC